MSSRMEGTVEHRYRPQGGQRLSFFGEAGTVVAVVGFCRHVGANRGRRRSYRVEWEWITTGFPKMYGKDGMHLLMEMLSWAKQFRQDQMGMHLVVQ